jgi:hypothetical protein
MIRMVYLLSSKSIFAQVHQFIMERRKAYSVQLIEQAPGPRGSPQLPQAVTGISFCEKPSPRLAAANTDNCFSNFLPLHEGHSIAVEALTSSSKFFPQSLQTYSKIGITDSSGSF